MNKKPYAKWLATPGGLDCLMVIRTHPARSPLSPMLRLSSAPLLLVAATRLLAVFGFAVGSVVYGAAGCESSDAEECVGGDDELRPFSFSPRRGFLLPALPGESTVSRW